MSDNETIKTKLALMDKDIKYIKDGVDENRRAIRQVKKTLEDDYVRNKDLKILWYIVFAIAGSVVTYAFTQVFSVIK